MLSGEAALHSDSRRLDVDAARRHVAERLIATPFTMEPFPHFQVEGLFPAAVYRDLVAVMRDEDFEPVANFATGGYEKRRVLQFDTHSVRSESRQPAFWDALTRDVLFHPEVVDPLIAKCAPHSPFGTEQLFRREPHRVTLHAIHDAGDYELYPHTDLSRKLTSVLVYLPDVSGLPASGTVLYRPKNPRNVCQFGDNHYRAHQFDPCVTVPYEANRALAFVRSERSFHGVPRQPAGGRRHVLQLVISRTTMSDIYPERGNKC